MKATKRGAMATACRCLASGLLSAILCGACGLPVASTLTPPVDCKDLEVDGVLSYCSASPGPLFRGYEIYYMVVAATEATPVASHYQDLIHGFGRMSRDQISPCDADELPLVDAIEADSDHKVSLDVSPLRDGSEISDQEPFLSMSWDLDHNTIVGRDKPDEFDACTSFSERSEYQAGDSDITNAAVAAIANGGLIDLVTYAVSYGRDRGEDRYSAPFFIGRVELTLPSE